MSTSKSPHVASFYDLATATFTHVVYDRAGGRAAIVDPVLDFDPSAGRTSTASADRVLRFLQEQRLAADWILETHAHADHLTAADYLKSRTGAQVAIGRGIIVVQQRCSALFGLKPEFPADGSQFDRLLDEGDTIRIGELTARALATPGHTDDGLTYVIGDAAFVGDTLFGADTGTARADFPGGDARQLYRSIRRLLELPPETRLFMCHDYKAPGRDTYAWETTVGEERARNVHVRDGIGEDEFAAMRNTRDATLVAPTLLLPSIQVNIRAGHFPPAEANGVRYLKVPVKLAS